MFGVHSGSGMRIASGCPARLLYGVQGGCEACKCVVPSVSTMKRVCPYYGPAGVRNTARSAWEQLKVSTHHTKHAHTHTHTHTHTYTRTHAQCVMYTEKCTLNPKL